MPAPYVSQGLRDNVCFRSWRLSESEHDSRVSRVRREQLLEAPQAVLHACAVCRAIFTVRMLVRGMPLQTVGYSILAGMLLSQHLWHVHLYQVITHRADFFPLFCTLYMKWNDTCRCRCTIIPKKLGVCGYPNFRIQIEYVASNIKSNIK